MSVLSWTSPSSGLLGTYIELDSGSPLFSAILSVTDSIQGAAIVANFTTVSGQIPDNHTLVDNGDNTATLSITPDIKEMDDYVPEYAQPPDFVYDSSTIGGGNYASYGSALSGGKTFSFTIRAETTDTNGIISADRSFSMRVNNNWTSDSEKFLLEYYSGTTLKDADGNELSPENYIIYLKSNGWLG